MAANTRIPRHPHTPSPANAANLPRPTPAAAFPVTASDPDVSLTRPQAAKVLAISEAYLKKLDLEGRGPAAYRIGRRWTYLKKDLLAWREAFRVEGLLANLPLAETTRLDPAALPPPVPDDPSPPRRRGRRPAAEAQREVA